jgi:hypothetical protein
MNEYDPQLERLDRASREASARYQGLADAVIAILNSHDTQTEGFRAVNTLCEEALTASMAAHEAWMAHARAVKS